MKVLIIEDEMPAAGKLQRMLEKADPSITITETLGSVESTLNWLTENPAPDLIFMDIQLEDGICFEVFEKFDLTTPVIFTTAYNEYSLKAFKVNSVDYLLKPIDPEELKKALNKFRTIHYRKDDLIKIDSIIKQLQPRRKERFLVKIREHYKSIPVTDVKCFFVAERCNFMNVEDDKIYPVDYSLDKIEEMLDPGTFFRVNRNYIINYAAINDIISYSSNRLKIILKDRKDKDDIIISRDRVPEFKKWIDR